MDDDTPETLWVRSIIESEHMLLEDLSDEEFEKLVDDWWLQALKEGDRLDRKELHRQLLYWVEAQKTSR